VTGLAPDLTIHNVMIDACARTGDVDGTEQWIRSMPEAGVDPDVVSYSSVLHGCAKVGQADRAESWLK